MDLIDDINTDHDRIWAQIGRLEAVRDESPRREGLKVLVILISTYVRAEEAVFYSTLKTLTPELSNKLVAEHQVISSGGLRDLSVLSASEAMWLAKLQVLRDEVLHHFQGDVGACLRCR